jgi:peptidoglycan/LPS O-acetylase OafA/YrhL
MKKLRPMPVGTILLVILVLLLLGVAPAWPYSRDFGWGPSGIVGVLVVVLLILLLTGRI